MIYSWQTVNTGNLAEQVCRPTDYFDLGQPVTVLPQDCGDAALHEGPLIFGGSGLLYPEIAPTLEKAVKAKRHPMICWGIGHNTHGGTSVSYPDWLKAFDLVGLRDWDTPYHYVPCPSCMHPAFNVDYGEPSRPLVIYDQFDYPVKSEFAGVPRENNFHPAEDMAKIISFLASGETIITSSYHGAYWGMLLNRKVLLWKPWSTKFQTYKQVPPTADSEGWQRIPATAFPDFLEECRSCNRWFAERVKLVISSGKA